MKRISIFDERLSENMNVQHIDEGLVAWNNLAFLFVVRMLQALDRYAQKERE